MVDEERVGNLLIQWTVAREAGQEIPVDELCADCPELIGEVTNRIHSLAAMDWLLDEPDDLADETTLSLPDVATLHEGSHEPELPASSLSPKQLIDALVSRGLFSDAEAAELRLEPVPNDSRRLARKLIDSNRLTTYQARVLLKQSDEPLVLDQYEILNRINSGGMGVVYKARHRSMDRIVALKTLPLDAVDSDEKIRRFQREVKASARLVHENIVSTYDARQVDGQHFLVMEYIDGCDLSSVVAMHGPLSVGKAVDFILQAARGLRHAHRQNIIHRDIKPGNLLLDRVGKVKILDMGLARLEGRSRTDYSRDLTATGAIMGTAGYMAPEQALDVADADQRSDLYSLGCTLYFLLTGRAPFAESTVMKTVLAHQQQPAPMLRGSRIDVPSTLNKVCARLLAKKPKDRFQDIGQVIASLESCGIVDTEPPLSLDKPLHKEAFAETPSLAASGPARRTDLSQSRTIPRTTTVFTVVAAILVLGYVSKTQTPQEDDAIRLQDTGIIDRHDSEPDKEGPTTLASEATTPSESTRDHDREVADWVLERNGRVAIVKHDDSFQWLENPEKLPPTPFRVRRIVLDTHHGARRVRDEDVGRFIELPELVAVDLSGQELSKSVVDDITRLPPLEKLGLFGCPLEDADFARIVDHQPAIINLNMGDTLITRHAIHDLVRLRSLAEVFLRGVPLEDSDIAQLESLPSLRMLIIPYTKLSNTGLARMTGWQGLQYIDVRETKITLEGIRQFKAARPDCKIDAELAGDESSSGDNSEQGGGTHAE